MYPLSINEYAIDAETKQEVKAQGLMDMPCIYILQLMPKSSNFRFCHELLRVCINILFEWNQDAISYLRYKLESLYIYIK